MKAWIWAGAAAFVYSSASFMTTFDNAFLNDDFEMMGRSTLVFSHLASLFQPDYAGRLLVTCYVYLGLLHRILGLNPLGYHAVTLFLHLMAFLWVMILGRRMRLNSWGAMAAGVFFLVLSIHFQTVGGVISSGRILMVVLCLISFLLFDDFRRSRKPQRMIASGFLWFLAMNCVEDAVVLPFLFLGYDCLILGNNPLSKENRNKFLIYVPLFFTQVAFFLIQYFFAGQALRSYVVPEPEILKKGAGILWSIANLFVPRREALQNFIEPAGLIRLLIPMFIFFPLGVVSFWLRRSIFKEPRFFGFSAFCFLWFLITFASFSLREVGLTWREYPPPRYLYWASMGMGLFVGKFTEVVLKAIGSLKKAEWRRLAYSSVAAAGVYFYVLNVWTYCFMVDKLCRIACRNAPVGGLSAVYDGGVSHG